GDSDADADARDVVSAVRGDGDPAEVVRDVGADSTHAGDLGGVGRRLRTLQHHAVGAAGGGRRAQVDELLRAVSGGLALRVGEADAVAAHVHEVCATVDEATNGGATAGAVDDGVAGGEPVAVRQGQVLAAHGARRVDVRVAVARDGRSVGGEQAVRLACACR